MSEALVLQGVSVFFSRVSHSPITTVRRLIQRGGVEKNFEVGSIYLRAKKKRVTFSPIFPFSFFFVSAGAVDANTARKAVGEGTSCSA